MPENSQSTFTAIVKGDASQAVSEFKKMGGQIDQTVTGSSKKVDVGTSRMGERFSSLGAKVGAALTVGAVVTFANTTVQAASRLEQSIGGTEAVFGKSAKTIDSWARNAATSMGLSEAAARDSLTLMGAQLKNFGFSVEDAQAKGKDLVQLGADLAATFGGTTEEAVSALTAALRGEMDPIERYGVSLNDARLKAKALELGLYDGKGALDSNAKASASLALITEQTAAAQGQFAREVDTTAGKEAVAAAKRENAAARLGKIVVPAWNSFLDVVTKTVEVATGSDAKTMDEPINAMSKAFDEARGKSGQTLKVFSDLITAAGDSRSSLDKAKVAVTSFFSGLTGGTPVADERLRNMKKAFTELANTAPDDARQVYKALGDLLRLADSGDGDAKRLANSLKLTDDVLSDLAQSLPPVRVETERYTDANKEGAEAAYYAAQKQAELDAATQGAKRAAAEAASGFQSYLDVLNQQEAFLNIQSKLDDMIGALGEGKSLAEQDKLAIEQLFATTIANGNLLASYNFKVAVDSGNLMLAQKIIDDIKAKAALGTTFIVRAGVSTSADLRNLMEGRGKYEGKAGGGLVNAGQPYVVGEHRPELFVPSVPGRIYPNAGGGGGGVTVVVNAPVGANLMEAGRQVADALRTFYQGGGQRVA